MNPVRVLVTTLALGALIGTILCPWWRYRADKDLVKVYAEAQSFSTVFDKEQHHDFVVGTLETKVGMKPLWEIQDYEVRDWLPFNVIQMAGILAAWMCGLSLAKKNDGVKPTVTDTATE